jgi:hypothetical protein
MRRLRWIVVLVVAVLAAVVLAAFFLVRPGLDDGRAEVDARWTPLRPALIARYDALGGVAEALRGAGAGDRAVTTDLDSALARWDRFALRGPKHTDPGSETTIANELEGLAERVRRNVLASAKLQADVPLGDALAAFDQAVVPQPAIAAYNKAVRAYEDDRSGFFDRIVADALGYDSRPVLVVGTGA